MSLRVCLLLYFMTRYILDLTLCSVVGWLSLRVAVTDATLPVEMMMMMMLMACLPYSLMPCSPRWDGVDGVFTILSRCQVSCWDGVDGVFFVCHIYVLSWCHAPSVGSMVFAMLD